MRIAYPEHRRYECQWIPAGKVVLISLKFKYNIDPLNSTNSYLENSDFKFTFLKALLSKTTALLAVEHNAVCIFVNDICDEAVLEKFSALRVVCKSFICELSSLTLVIIDSRNMLYFDVQV